MNLLNYLSRGDKWLENGCLWGLLGVFHSKGNLTSKAVESSDG